MMNRNKLMVSIVITALAIAMSLMISYFSGRVTIDIYVTLAVKITVLSVIIFTCIALLFLGKGSIFERLGHIFVIMLILLVSVMLIDAGFTHSTHKFGLGRLFPDVQIGRYPKPYVMFCGKPNSEIPNERVRLNSLGYIGNVPAMHKDKGEFRIIVLGPSQIMYGQPTFTDLIEAEFHKNSYHNVKMYNFGVISSSTSLDLARLVFEAVDYEPDMIVECSGPTDILEQFMWDPRPGYPGNFILYEANPLLKDVGEYPLIPLILYKSKILRKFFPGYFIETFTHLHEIRKSVDYRSRRWAMEIARVFMQNLIKEKKIAQAYGADFVAFYLPTLHMKKHLSPDEARMADASSIQGFNDYHDLTINEVANNFKDGGFELIDLSFIFDDTPDSMFKDSLHLNAQGREIAAKTVYRYLKDRMLSSDLRGREKE